LPVIDYLQLANTQSNWIEANWIEPINSHYTANNLYINKNIQYIGLWDVWELIQRALLIMGADPSRAPFCRLVLECRPGTIWSARLETAQVEHIAEITQLVLFHIRAMSSKRYRCLSHFSASFAMAFLSGVTSMILTTISDFFSNSINRLVFVAETMCFLWGTDYIIFRINSVFKGFRLQVALHASHAALPMVTSKFRPNIALPTLAPILLMQLLQRHVYYIYTTKFR
jgi:hypothetical protein